MGKYVITGGPCTGKTTTIEELQRRGFPVIEEAARAIIKREKEKRDRNESHALPDTDLYEFNELVTQYQLEREEEIVGEVFLDRSMIDNFAYCKLGNILVPPILEGCRESKRYDHVFLLDLLPPEFYENDTERKEERAKAVVLHEAIADAYVECGYDVIQVPFLPIAERAEYILKHIGITVLN